MDYVTAFIVSPATGGVRQGYWLPLNGRKHVMQETVWSSYRSSGAARTQQQISPALIVLRQAGDVSDELFSLRFI